MNLFNKNFGPVFLKESTAAKEYIDKLQSLAITAKEPLKSKIEKQIALAQYGIEGEKNVAYQLRYAGMDMYILHDIYLEYKDLSAQIDYILITRKRTYILECKNLSGNIEVNNRGEFIRKYSTLEKNIQEGTESPLSQNARHLQVIKELRKEAKGNFIAKKIFETYFEDNYKSLVVLTNPKTVLYTKYAKKEVKEQIVRLDQLLNRIRELDAEVKNNEMSDKEMRNLADFFFAMDKLERTDYAKRYEELVSKMQEEQALTNIQEDVVSKEPTNPIVVSSPDIISKLKAFRLEQARSEKMKPYYIFNDAQMMELVEKNPKSKEELLNVSGFGPVKVEKYGETILKLLSE